MTEFDLSQMRSQQLGGAHGALALRAVFTGCAGLSGGLLVYLLAAALRNGPGTEASYVFTSAVIAMVAVFLGAAIFGLFGVREGAISCTVDAIGITLRYPNGRSRVTRWHDSSLSLRLAKIAGPTGTSYDLLTRSPFHNPLSPEAFDAILLEVDRLGLEVRSTSARARGLTLSTYEVRPNRHLAG
jgi:hypothetical protein